MRVFHYKVINQIIINNMQRRKNMVKIHKFVYAFTIFLSLIVLVSGYRKFFFISISNFILYQICNGSFLFSNTPLFLFNITGFKFCRTDNECPTIMCNPPDISKCVRKTCYCMQQKPKKRVKK
jgi:hypothetical protein